MMQPIVICPKCSGEMVQVRRSGVLVDLCSQCSGIFLDRGELEKIVALEPKDEPVPTFDNRSVARQPDISQYEDRDRGRKKKSRKRSFLEELLDID